MKDLCAVSRPTQGLDMEHAERRLWKVQDVARYLAVGKSWVYDRAASGLLPSLHVGGLLRFDPEAVAAWVRQQPSTR